MTVNARGLARDGHLRPGMTPEQAADIMWTYSWPELYELLVIHRGWPAGQYGRFAAQALTAALLPARSTRGHISSPTWHRTPRPPLRSANSAREALPPRRTRMATIKADLARPRPRQHSQSVLGVLIEPYRSVATKSSRKIVI